MRNDFETSLEYFKQKFNYWRAEVAYSELYEDMVKNEFLFKYNDTILRALTIAIKLAAQPDALPVWRDIESAPRDGTPMLFMKEGGIEIGWFNWCPHERTYYPSNEDAEVLTPTHWQPLPSSEDTRWREIKDLLDHEILSINSRETL